MRKARFRLEEIPLDQRSVGPERRVGGDWLVRRPAGWRLPERLAERSDAVELSLTSSAPSGDERDTGRFARVGRGTLRFEGGLRDEVGDGSARRVGVSQ